MEQEISRQLLERGTFEVIEPVDSDINDVTPETILLAREAIADNPCLTCRFNDERLSEWGHEYCCTICGNTYDESAE
jgi:hypothetical protein